MDWRKSIFLCVAVVTIIAMGGPAVFAVRPTYAEAIRATRGAVHIGGMEQHVKITPVMPSG